MLDLLPQQDAAILLCSLIDSWAETEPGGRGYPRRTVHATAAGPASHGRTGYGPVRASIPIAATSVTGIQHFRSATNPLREGTGMATSKLAAKKPYLESPGDH